MEAKVSLCVCLGHQGDGLTQTLDCARQATSTVSVLVADHGSTEEESNALQWANHAINVIHMDRKRWTAGANQLNDAWHGEYSLYSDPGIRFPVDLLEQMIRYMDKHPDVVILSPLILDAENRVFPLPRYPLVLRDLLSVLLYSHGRTTRRFKELTQPPRFFNEPADIRFASSRFMMIRSDVLRALKGFDPGYGRYMADYDLCERIRSAHLGRIVIHPGLQVQSEKAFSGVEDSAPFRWLSAIRFAFRWHLRP